MRIEPGDVFAGKYRIERLLGAGGMGEVYAATHLELGELVALKLMLDGDAGTDALARFQREARAAARLKSEFIGRVLDVGRLDGAVPFIVLEYLDGQDLERVLTERAPLPIADAVGFVAQACEGVAEAHALGMVHRDLKLKNLFLTSRADGRPLVKILDFGIVKVARGGAEIDQPSLTLTQADAMIGSAHYMSPEQIMMSSKVDARADVWSLGVCLHTLLAGEEPFQGESLAVVITAITGRPAPSVRASRPEIPQALADVVERALEKSLNRRFQSVAELARALAPFIGDATLGDRVEAVLRGRAKALVAGTASEPVLAPTRNVGPRAVEALAPEIAVSDVNGGGGGTTRRAPPRRLKVPAVDTAPLVARPPAFVAPAELALGAAPASAAAHAPPVASRGRPPWPLVLLGALFLVVAGSAGAWRLGSHARATPASSASAVTTATQALDAPAVALTLAPSATELPVVTVAPPADPSAAPPATAVPALVGVKARPRPPAPVHAPASASAAPGAYDKF